MKEALLAYDAARELLFKENDVDALWKCIVAADHVRDLAMEQLT